MKAAADAVRRGELADVPTFTDTQTAVPTVVAATSPEGAGDDLEVITSNWHDRHEHSLTRGQRAADALRNGMGSWPFIGCFLATMLAWAVLNSTVLRADAWDPYPYILLNLFLSMLAGLQGAILLIAAKRQDAVSAAMAAHDYETNIAAKAEIDRLIERSAEHTQTIVELHAMVQQLLART